MFGLMRTANPTKSTRTPNQRQSFMIFPPGTKPATHLNTCIPRTGTSILYGRGLWKQEESAWFTVVFFNISTTLPMIVRFETLYGPPQHISRLDDGRFPAGGLGPQKDRPPGGHRRRGPDPALRLVELAVRAL